MVGKRKAYFFAKPEWRAITACVPQNYYDKLVDELTPLPGLMEKIDELNLQENVGEIAANASDLLQQGLRLGVSFGNWYKTFKLSHPHPYDLAQRFSCLFIDERRNSDSAKLNSEQASCESKDTSDDYPFSLYYNFDDPLVVHGLSLYWAGWLLLIRQMLIVYEKLAAVGVVISETSWFPTDATELKGFGCIPDHEGGSSLEDICAVYADKICYSIRSCTAENMGAVGPNSILFPMWVASQFYQSQSDDTSQRKSQWLMQVYAKLQWKGWNRP
jgi:hypothetical protein